MTLANDITISSVIKDWLKEKGFQFHACGSITAGFGVYTHGIWLCDLVAIKSEKNARLVAVYGRHNPQLLNLASPNFYAELTNLLDAQRTSYWLKVLVKNS